MGPGPNTIGAAAGVLTAGFLLVPLFGVLATSWVIAGINIIVGIAAYLLNRRLSKLGGSELTRTVEAVKINTSQISAALIVFATGFATFAVEISWFRSLTASFGNTTDVFAIMLCCVLIALGAGSRLVPRLKQKNISLAGVVNAAGVLILLATPLIERFDVILTQGINHGAAVIDGQSRSTSVPTIQISALIDQKTLSANWVAIYLYAVRLLQMFLMTLYAIGLPILFLGMAFPWILDDQKSARQVGCLYALNTFAAVLGSIGAAWFLLPTVGFVHTAWIAGIMICATGLFITVRSKRFIWAIACLVSLFVAINLDSGIGITRVQGQFFNFGDGPAKILESFEGPQATASVIEYDDGGRRLVIDSASAAGQSGSKYNFHESYMRWMGQLPMLLHPHPENALVICFGTGQTANAVRQENPQSLDIVDINPSIFRLGHNFSANQDVLNDPRVHAIAMDGRAYVRRVSKEYDVITLEPMPPTAAGVNALYSRQFYLDAKNKLTSQGIIAQWLPFHSVASRYAASIVTTFTSVFPNSILWIDPASPRDGILLATKNENMQQLGTVWPGLMRHFDRKDIDADKLTKAIILNREGMKNYAVTGEIISDDNQLLGSGLIGYSQ